MGKVNETEHLKTVFRMLRTDLKAARDHLDNRGGQHTNGPAPYFVRMPMSDRIMLERYVRWAIGDDVEGGQ